MDGEVCPITQDSYATAGLCGMTIDRYHVEQWLGGGGFGAVYRARHTVMDRPVALKVLHARMRTQPAAVKRFFGEAKAATAIGHPGIVQVFDAGTTPEGHAFLAMELVDGCSLKELLEAGPIAPSRGLRIIIAVLDALAAAHHAGIIHRDVKPGNIMLGGTDPGGPRRDDRVRLVDFGVSKARQTRDPDDITRSGMAMGSPGYAAPEQYVSAKTADARSDIYGVSVVLYQLLTGMLPFDAESYEQMVVKVCSSDPRPLGRMTDQVPPALAEIVDRGVARRPEARWPTAEDMVGALRPWITRLEGATAPTQLAPSTPPPAMKGFDTLSREDSFVDAEPDGAASADEAVTVPDNAHATSRPPPAGAVVDEPAKKRSGALLALGALLVLLLLVVGGGAAFVITRTPEEAAPSRLEAPPATVPVAAEAEPTVPVPVASAPGPNDEAQDESTDAQEIVHEEEGAEASETGEAAPAETTPTPMMRRRVRRSRMGARANGGDAQMSAMREFGFEDIEPFDPD